MGIIMATNLAQSYRERREYKRFEVVQAIFIEVVNRRSQSESENTIIRCETADVSVGGLKIYVQQPIRKGSRLNIAVPLDNGKQNLELVGEAIWIKPADGVKGYWVGLELHDSNRDNMERWFRVVHSLSSTPPP